MLQGGGNRWLGMLFGMTTRLPWSSEKVKADPRPVWKIWDKFQIQDAKMIGFWEDNPPVTTTHSGVKATVSMGAANSDSPFLNRRSESASPTGPADSPNGS